MQRLHSRTAAHSTRVVIPAGPGRWQFITRIIPAGGAGRNARRYLPGTLNANPFGAAALSRKQQYLAAWYPEVFCKQADEVAIGLAIDGGCAQPDLQAIAMGAIQ
jgi:hypothetical protein